MLCIIILALCIMHYVLSVILQITLQLACAMCFTVCCVFAVTYYGSNMLYIINTIYHIVFVYRDLYKHLAYTVNIGKIILLELKGSSWSFSL